MTKYFIYVLAFSLMSYSGIGSFFDPDGTGRSGLLSDYGESSYVSRYSDAISRRYSGEFDQVTEEFEREMTKIDFSLDPGHVNWEGAVSKAATSDYHASELPDSLQTRLKDFNVFRALRAQHGKDMIALKEALRSQPFVTKDYQGVHASISDTFRSINGVSVVCVTHRPWDLENILSNFQTQSYDAKELILVLNGHEYDERKVQERINAFRAKTQMDVTLLTDCRDQLLGDCLNRGSEKAKFDVVTKFDGDDFYGSHYLSDMLEPFLWSQTDVAGKTVVPFYWAKEGLVTFFTTNQCADLGKERVFYAGSPSDPVNPTGSTVTFRKELLRKIQFPGRILGEDEGFFSSARAEGLRFASTEFTEHVACRKDPLVHTWRPTINQGFKVDELHKVYDGLNLSGFVRL